jgi:hypothetical protein
MIRKTLANAITDTLTTLKESTTTPAFWTRAEVASKIIDAIKEVAWKAKLWRYTEEIGLSHDVRTYMWPSGIVQILRVEYDDKKIPFTTSLELDIYDDNWKTREGAPVAIFTDLVTIEEFEVYRLPDADSYTVDVYYIGYPPTDIMEGTEAEELPAPFCYYYDPLMNYAVWKCLAKEGETQNLPKAQIYRGYWMEDFGRLLEGKKLPYMDHGFIGEPFGGTTRKIPRLPEGYPSI